MSAMEVLKLDAGCKNSHGFILSAELQLCCMSMFQLRALLASQDGNLAGGLIAPEKLVSRKRFCVPV